jgi:hypothetical protein
MLGYYQNFPVNLHRVEGFNSTLSIKQLQQRVLKILYDLNKKEFTFEEVANPSVPEGTVIFEFGLAKGESFNYIDVEELKLAQDFLLKERVQLLDFFCSIRYYRGNGEKRMPLKFDYLIFRVVFGNEFVEFRVFHERGPRYISPEELLEFVVGKINQASKKPVLRKQDV